MDNTRSSKQQTNNRTVQQRLKIVHYRLAAHHIISTIGNLPKIIAKPISRVVWGKRIWNDYPIPVDKNGNELLFIHIPKCAGTSVARMLGYAVFPHFPAFAFACSDAARFKKAKKITVIRNPADRLQSILMHFANSPMASQQEQALAEQFQISEERIDLLVSTFFRDPFFRRQLMTDTRVGLAGFDVPQVEWIQFSGELIVDLIYDLTSLEKLAIWLSDFLDRKIVLKHFNSSNRMKKQSLLPSTIEFVNEKLEADHALWKNVISKRGILHYIE